jgi:hypothetical protein
MAVEVGLVLTDQLKGCSYSHDEDGYIAFIYEVLNGMSTPSFTQRLLAMNA